MNNRKYDTKAIIEVGLMSALIVVITLMNSYVPLFSTFGMFILPLPITILYLRHNFNVSIIAVMVSALIVAITGDPIMAIGSAALYGASGLVMGYCLKNKVKPINTVIYAGFANLVGVFVNLYLYVTLIMNTTMYGLLGDFINQLKQSMELSKGLYSGLGVDISANPMYAVFDAMTPKTFLLMIPAAFIVSMPLMAYINYQITRKVLKKLRYETEAFRTFITWYFDNRLGALIVIFICIGILLTSRGIGLGEYITSTFMILFQVMLLIQALSLVAYFLRSRFNINKGFVIFILIFIALNPSISNLLVFLGLVDMLLDLRKLDPNSLYGALIKKFKK